MSSIRIEAVPIQQFGLGFLGFDHLQIVFQGSEPEFQFQDFWYVIEGVRDIGLNGSVLGAEGESGRVSLSFANRAFQEDLEAKIGTPADRGSREIIRDGNAIVVWDGMAQYAAEIEIQSFPYIANVLPLSNLPVINSNSLIASILWSVGIDVSTVMPFTFGFRPGIETLLGTTADDAMSTTSTFTTLVGGVGNDTFTGGQNGLFVTEKFYGGSGDDIFNWSTGRNIYHGGQPRLEYTRDGFDTVNYTGVGYMTVDYNPYAVDNKSHQFEVFRENGTDYLFSIERIVTDQTSDIVNATDDVILYDGAVFLDFRGQQSGGRGDEFLFGGSGGDVIINYIGDDLVSVQAKDSVGQAAGYWAKSLEWVAGSDGDDAIYVGGSLKGAQGGKGDDILEALGVEPLSGESPLGYDVELYGDDGDDTLISGLGRTIAFGGSGADKFVLAGVSTADVSIEFVIDDADMSDTFYIPYDLFQLQPGSYEGSQLMRIAGGPFTIDPDVNEAYFYWGDPPYNPSQFLGDITYSRDGADLILSIYQSVVEDYTPDYGPGEPPGETVSVIRTNLETLTTVRVKNWSDGLLGISFPMTFDPYLDFGSEDVNDYPGLRAYMAATVAADRFIDGVESRPDAYVPEEIASLAAPQSARITASAASAGSQIITGSAGADILEVTSTGRHELFGDAGNDTLVGGSASDVLDGGVGTDAMSGGAGNDIYIVDDAADSVIELAKQGFDRVYASIDYALQDNVEHLDLVGSAVSGVGNDLRNRIIGNENNNTLRGFGGDDVLAGNLGDDVLIGGSGSDGYVYELGDGRDVIIDTSGDLEDVDALVVTGSITAQDIKLVRSPNSANDLTLYFSDGGSVTSHDYFAGGGAGIDRVIFDDGTQWDSAELASRALQALTDINFAPRAADDYVVRRVTQLTTTLQTADLLLNDIDVDGDAMSVVSITDVGGGAAVLNGDGTITLTRSGLETSTISFRYTVGDGSGALSAAIATVVLRQETNAVPVITSTAFSTVSEDAPAIGSIVVTDADNDALAYAVKADAAPTKGVVTFTQSGQFIYTPTLNANGPDAFTVVVSDGRGGTVEQTFAFDILAVNDAPSAVADTGYTTRSGQQLRIDDALILANDSDLDGDALSVSAIRALNGGAATLDTAGDIVFTAATGFSGTAQLEYDIIDGAGGLATSTIDINVMPAIVSNTAPTIQRSTMGAVTEDRFAHGRIIARDSDGDALQYSVTPGSGPSRGSISFGPNGHFTYTPDANENGLERFSITVSDGRGGDVDLPFAFAIKAVNDRPVAVNDFAVIANGFTPFRISAQSLLANDTDVDGDVLSLVAVMGARGGRVAIDAATGDVLFTARRGSGSDAGFTYRVSDGNGVTDTAFVSVNVQSFSAMAPWGYHSSPIDWTSALPQPQSAFSLFGYDLI